MDDKLYAERDIDVLGGYYINHASAMTTEKLHSKSAIAAELAYRDMQIATLAADARRWQAVRDGSYELLHNLSTAPAQYREQIIDEVSK